MILFHKRPALLARKEDKQASRVAAYTAPNQPHREPSRAVSPYDFKARSR